MARLIHIGACQCKSLGSMTTNTCISYAKLKHALATTSITTLEKNNISQDHPFARGRFVTNLCKVLKLASENLTRFEELIELQECDINYYEVHTYSPSIILPTIT